MAKVAIHVMTTSCSHCPFFKRVRLETDHGRGATMAYCIKAIKWDNISSGETETDEMLRCRVPEDRENGNRYPVPEWCPLSEVPFTADNKYALITPINEETNTKVAQIAETYNLSMDDYLLKLVQESIQEHESSNPTSQDNEL